MYESARDKLAGLIQQEQTAKEQIAHWAPVVEKLAEIAGESVPEELRARIAMLKDVKQPEGVEDMGLTEAIRWVFRQPLLLPLTPTQVRDRLAEMGYDLGKYAHVMPPIHNTLKRMKENGEIEEVDNVGGLGKAFRSAK
jgi:hypothetical protein